MSASAMFRGAAAMALLLALPGESLAQGTDQTPAQRDVMVIAHWLPGFYDNNEQVYFASRGGQDRNAIPHANWTVYALPTKIEGKPAFLAVRRTGEAAEDARVWTLDAAARRDRVRMEQWRPRGRLPALDDQSGWSALKGSDLVAVGCPLLWRKDAGQFTAEAEADCTTTGIRHGQLTGDGLWLGENAAAVGRYLRGRRFVCYVDMPGVGGGRAIPFKRFDGMQLHDQGGSARFTTVETPPRTLEISLRNVNWEFNNAPGIFTRDSLVLYVSEIAENGTATELAYVFGEPDAERVGVNLKWLLANCAMRPQETATPEF